MNIKTSITLLLSVLIAAPAAVGLVILAEPLVATIFYGGAFNAFDVEMTALALQAFAAGLLGFSFVKILAPAYFAREDTRTPVRIGLIALAVNFGLSVILAWILTKAGYAGTHAGLALAISVAALLNAWLLYRGLRKDGVLAPGRGWTGLLLRVLFANAVMIGCVSYLDRPLDWWLSSAVWDRAAWLAVVVSVGAIGYFLALLLAGARPSQFRHRSD